MGCTANQIIKFNGTAWVCAADTGITAEVDGVIGNEVFEITSGNGLSRTGTKAAGYNVSINSPTCAAGTYLQWNGTAFVCTAALTTEVDGVIGNEVFDNVAGTGISLSGSKAAGYTISSIL